MTRPKLKMLKSNIPMLDTTRGIKMAPSLPRFEKKYRPLKLDGAAWRRLRASVLAEEPLCRDCRARGILTAATEVDHRDNDPANNERENLVSLCKPCHSRKTQADMGKNVRMGCDVHGMPLDPSHPWNRPPEGRTAALLRPAASPRAREDSEITKG